MADSQLYQDLNSIVIQAANQPGGKLTDQDIENIASLIGKSFGTRPDEVALLRVSSDGKNLSFLYPQKMANVGNIPISTTTGSLAVKTVRERRGEMVNNFSTYKHLTVFEAVPLSPETPSAPIRKIMSCPVLVNDDVVGVVQVSRKATAGDVVGPDFTRLQLNELAAAVMALGPALT